MPKILFLAAFSLIACASASHAVSIANIDTLPHRVQVTPSPGQQAYVVEIPVNRTVQIGTIPSNLKLLTGEQSRISNARDHDEYVIWPGGKMVIQQRRHIKGSTNY